jgi:Asp-tRNA(Asn)/Glu-tRNA(Gln) amidotransferase A subunit family amidase
MNPSELSSLPATEAARAIAAGELLSEDLVGACLAAIEARDSEVMAWQALDPDLALQQARDCDEMRQSGRLLGPLHGVPVGLKDNIDTVDLPTEDGTVLHAGRRPMVDATVTARLRSAGAVILGKTVTTEFAYFTPGKTRNPHNPGHTPGGSSSGSAAAVAAGMVPVAIGTQTNGSVIRPAAFCGVVGFKPSFGAISRHGVLRTSRSLDQVGVFARSVGDAALIAQCLAGHDPEDPDTHRLSWQQLAAVAASAPPLEPLFGLLRSPLWEHAAADTGAGFEELSEELGPRCLPFDLGETALVVNRTLQTVMRAEMAFNLGGEYRRGRQSMSDRLIELIESGQQVSAVEYQQAAALVSVLHEEIDALFDACDALMLPSAPGSAPAGLDATGDPVFCSMASLLGLPAISLPLMVGDNGLPIGVQLVGRRLDDGRLLRAANWLVARLASEG